MTGGGPILPPPVTGWPCIAGLSDTAATQAGSAEIQAAVAQIRAEYLWWPAPRHDAGVAAAICYGSHAAAQARRDGYAAADIADGADPAGVAPDHIQAIYAPPGHPAHSVAAIAGLRSSDTAPSADDLLARILWRCPWTKREMSLADGLAAQSFLMRAARRNAHPMRLVGMSRWKRRCVAPFLAGPHGPPGDKGQPVVWGANTDKDGALLVEDGFLRSVGLGLRHTPPASLTFDRTAPYFDATRRNGFDETVAAADFTADLLRRAQTLRRRVLALRLSKYNLQATSAKLPTGAGRERVLVVGQVENDASIRLGAAGFASNSALLAHVRRASPDAFIIYKPHPDVLTGLRPGAAPDAPDLADHVETVASAPNCLDWADRVATITSLMGFEALLRGVPVTTYGRPFYAGWGLTDDQNPSPRDRRLTLDELTAAALILYPRYIDPITRLPAPPELVVERLADEMTAPQTLRRRMRDHWRGVISWLMSRV